MQNEFYNRQPKLCETKIPGGQHSLPNFEKGSEKLSASGNLKSSFHRYLPGVLILFLVKKNCKIKYGFEDSISNVDLNSAAK